MTLNLTKENWVKVGKGLLIAMTGAGLTYLGEFVSGTDFGDLTPLIVAGFSVLVNYVRKLGFAQIVGPSDKPIENIEEGTDGN